MLAKSRFGVSRRRTLAAAARAVHNSRFDEQRHCSPTIPMGDAPMIWRPVLAVAFCGLLTAAVCAADAPNGAFIDGHCACIEAAYREYQLSTDNKFLRQVWPGVKKAVDWLIGAIDAKIAARD